MISATDIRILTTLWDILETQNLKRILSWNLDGTAFTIWSIDNFSNTVLLQYSISVNFYTFTKKLQSLGFKMIKNVRKALEFRHPLFQRTEKQSIALIRRVSKPMKSFRPCENNQPSVIQQLQMSIIDLKRSSQQVSKEKQIIQSKISKFLASLYASIIKMSLKQAEQKFKVDEIMKIMSHITNTNEILNKEFIRKSVGVIGDVIQRDSQSTHHPQNVLSEDPLSLNQSD